jgi:hypothetical protein
MPGDYSRRTFQPLRDTAGVYEQQGRVRLDANLNELVDLIDRRLRATSLDTLGPAVVPVVTPDGFAIAVGGGVLTIGPGRAYVDGIDVDNHGRSRDGLAGPMFDGRLEEMRGAGVIPFDRQPYVPIAPSPFVPPAPASGPNLAYLDVWHRERTWVEDPTLLDPALYGVDTATRRQTIWQVKLFGLGGGAVDCDTPDSAIPGWDAVVRPAGARLTTNAVGVPTTGDPCVIPPSGGFRGVENRLYRVEIHDGGGFGTATFSWSRDNASLASPVLSISGNELGVVRPGRDQLLRFTTGDWVEVTDDDRELSGLPGEMARVQSVDDIRGVVVLTAPLAGAFNVANPADVNTRVRRWDQRPAGTTGLLTVTNAPIALEDGVEVTFSLDPTIAGAEFRPTEYWVFAARVADGSVEQLAAAPPVGPHHHIARLAIVDTTAGTVIDCRDHWPPPTTGDGGCDCDACVTPESHNSGAFTIQDAVNRVAGGGTVCLAVGVYRLRQTVTISNARAVRIRGKGWPTIILTPGDRPAFVVQGSTQVTFQDLTVLGIRSREEVRAGFSLGQLGGTVAIGIANSVGTTVERCVLVTNPQRRDRLPTLATLGIVAALTVRDCAIVGVVGIGNVLPVTEPGPRLQAQRAGAAKRRAAGSASAVFGVGTAIGTSDREQFLAGRILFARWSVVDNMILAGRAGVALLGGVVAVGDNRFLRNDVAALTDAGFAIAGISLLGPLVISDNVVASGGFGVLCGADAARIDDNTVIGFPVGRLGSIGETLTTTTETTIYPSHVCGEDLTVTTVVGVTTTQPQNPIGVGLRAGIVVLDPLGLGARLESVRIGGNEVVGVQGLGIAALTPIRRIHVDANHVANVVAGGIIVVAQRGESVVVSANTVERILGMNLAGDVGLSTGGGVAAFGLAGIAVLGPLRADVRENLVDRIATSRNRAFGIVLDSVRSGRVVANRVSGVGDEPGSAAGIFIDGPFGNAEAINNEVIGRPSDDEAGWIAIRIRGVVDEPSLVGTVVGSAMSHRIVFRNVVYLLGRRITPIDVGGELAAVRGNTVQGGGRLPSILVQVRGSAMVNDNRGRFDGEPRVAAFEISSVSATINANYVEVRPDALAIEANVPATAVATVGNVTNGSIRVDGAGLVAPWSNINVWVP